MAVGLAQAKMCRSLLKAGKGRATGSEWRVGSVARKEPGDPSEAVDRSGGLRWGKLTS